MGGLSGTRRNKQHTRYIHAHACNMGWGRGFMRPEILSYRTVQERSAKSRRVACLGAATNDPKYLSILLRERLKSVILKQNSKATRTSGKN